MAEFLKLAVLALLAVLMAFGVKARIGSCETPRAFKDAPIILLAAALICLALMGVTGLRF